MDADRAAEEAAGAAFAAAIDVAIATSSPSARLQFLSRVIDAVRANRAAFVGGATHSQARFHSAIAVLPILAGPVDVKKGDQQ